MMHGRGKSDSAILAAKPANKAEPPTAEQSVLASRCGAGGAKGGDQGECGLAKHAPDSALGPRVTGAGPHAANDCRWDPR